MSLEGELARLDAALLDLRRFAEAPGSGRRGSTLPHGSGRVEVSTVLVVDAVTRRMQAAAECSVGDVADAVHVTPSTASRLVERAVAAGMVRSARSDSDPRRVTLSLTDAGQRLQDEAVRFRTGRLAAILSDWPAGDVTTFTSLLERFSAAAHTSTKEKT